MNRVLASDPEMAREPYRVAPKQQQGSPTCHVPAIALPGHGGLARP